MRAAYSFVDDLLKQDDLQATVRVQVKLYGSLSATGVGHATDKSVLLGLMGFDPEHIDTQVSTSLIEDVLENKAIQLNQQKSISFDYKHDVLFLDESLPYHPNAMELIAYNRAQEILYAETYYSVGGGFIVSERQLTHTQTETNDVKVPYPFHSAAELLSLCRTHHLSVSELMLENEKSWRSEAEIRSKIMEIWKVMQQCIHNGLINEGILPGGLNVKRRAKKIHDKLLNKKNSNLIVTTFHAMEWVNLFALAVNEKNAAGGRVVTAPTNGAAGIIPAVLYY
ncbi:L-serine ammonia-lyase, partial [Acinetobacter baumannii]|nr:L-serine ammonia-lyase [Acinetobacter baumannii]